MTYYSFEIGHTLPAVTPETVGELSPSDLVGAASLFDHLYRQEG